MKLAQVILENERQNQGEKNKQLVRLRLKELVYAFPKEVTQVLHNSGVAVSGILPSAILLAVVTKNLHKNSLLREAIGKMLLEIDGYASAEGGTWQLVGGALAAIGSVLTGVGRSQTQQADSDAAAQQQQMQQQLELERAKRRRTTWMIVGISVVVLIGVIIAFKTLGKPKPKLQAV